MEGSGDYTAHMEWFEKAFGDDYETVYPHRDEDSARAEIEGLLERIGPLPDGPVVDVACGTGRHTRALAAAGRPCLGIDLSIVLLERAAARSSGIGWVRGDFRALPVRERSVAMVTSLFSSFGYLASADDDWLHLAAMARLAAPGGVMVLDVANPEAVRSTLVAESHREARGVSITEWRRIEGDQVVKDVVLVDGAGKREWTERLRLHSPERLAGWIASSGLVVQNLWGGFAGEAADGAAARRLFVARRSVDAT